VKIFPKGKNNLCTGKVSCYNFARNPPLATLSVHAGFVPVLWQVRVFVNERRSSEEGDRRALMVWKSGMSVPAGAGVSAPKQKPAIQGNVTHGRKSAKKHCSRFCVI
jgi:hypothetical protein